MWRVFIYDECSPVEPHSALAWDEELPALELAHQWALTRVLHGSKDCIATVSDEGRKSVWKAFWFNEAPHLLTLQQYQEQGLHKPLQQKVFDKWKKNRKGYR